MITKPEEVTPDWLRSKLKEHDYTQRSFAEALDYREAQVSRWLSTNRPHPIGAEARKTIFYYFQNLECQKSK